MTKYTAHNVTPDTIRSLASNAAQAGDLLMHAICQIALGNDDYADRHWLNDNTCLDRDECYDLDCMTRRKALATVVTTLNEGNQGHGIV